MKGKCPGFSLIELLIVIALIAIVSAIAVPQFQRYAANTDLKNAVREMTGDFSTAKQLAVANNLNYRIAIDVSGNSYTLSRTDTAAVLWTKSLVSFGRGTTIYNTTIPGAAVNFQSRGTVQAGGVVTLRNRLGSTAVITVNLTGRSYVQYTMQ